MRPSALAVFILITSYIDHQFEFGRLLYREIGRLGAFEDLIDVAGCTAEQISYVGAVHGQSAISVVSEQVVCRQMILRRERDNSRSLDKGQSIAKINYGIGVLGGGRGKGDVEFLGRGRLDYRQSHAQLAGYARHFLS